MTCTSDETCRVPGCIPTEPCVRPFGELLTPEEHRVMALTADLWNLLVTVVEDGPSRDADLAELAAHVHAIQNTVLAQAAARAYPTLYRRLGSTLRPAIRAKPSILLAHPEKP